MIVYEGITREGEKVKGVFAGTRQELFKYLKKEGIILVKFNEKRQEKPFNYSKRLSLSEIYDGFSRLLYLLEAGVKLSEAISVLINTSSLETSVFWQEVLKNLKEGNSLSQSIEVAAAESGVGIERVHFKMLSIGEEIGDIPMVLKKILEDYEFRRYTVAELKKSMYYPIFLVVMSVLSVIIVLGFVVPKFSSVFTQSDIEKLPLLSRVILQLGLVFKENLPFILFAILSLPVIFWVLLSSSEVKESLKKIGYKIPFLKDLLLKFDFAVVFSSLSSMLLAGVDIKTAVAAVSQLPYSDSFEKVLSLTQQELAEGKKLYEIWGKYSIFPREVIALIAVGENSKTLSDILNRLSKRYLTEFRNAVASLVSFLEPVIIIFVGVVIGIIIVSILLAIVSISDVL